MIILLFTISISGGVLTSYNRHSFQPGVIIFNKQDFIRFTLQQGV
jgi:hypothetical protein